MKWFVYMVEGNDKSLYTGITTDIERRIKEHNNDNKKGAKSLRSKRPVVLKYSEVFESQKSATKREAAIKGWPRINKIKLILEHD